jgi:hypothetical protein
LVAAALSPGYLLHVAGHGNAFWREITEVLADGLSELSRSVRIVEDEVPQALPGTVNLLVSPNEYFDLGPKLGEDELRAAVAVSACIVADQPETVWFARNLRWLHDCPLVLDMNTMGEKVLRAAGVPVRYLQLGYSARLDRWGNHGSRAHPIDVAFLGAMTDRRARFFADAAARLAGARCELRFFDQSSAKHAGDPGYLAGTDKWSRLAETRLLLNVHRSEEPYFEWARALETLANGCALVTEPSTDTFPLLPGTHLFVAPLECLADYARGVLANEELRSAVAQEAYDLLTGRLRMSQQFAPLIDELDGLAIKAAPPPPGPRTPAEEAAAPGDLPALGSVAEGVRRSAVASEVGGHGRGGAVDAEITVTPAWTDFQPEVSVIVTSFDQAEVIGRAIESVLASAGPPAELIVVDDHSSDGSVAVVRRHLETVEWMPAALVVKALTDGPSAARNAGFSLARGDKVLLMDGDHVLLPGALQVLASALDAGEAAFTWGMVATFGARTGVHHYLAWDPARLVEDNDVPALAMFPSSAWRHVGGFDTEDEGRSGGSEDHKLWLRLAGAGFVGELVPTFAGRYRTTTTEQPGPAAGAGGWRH